ncbi:subunit 2 of splicing factor 3A [Hamiltosporidium tvaerminnensis]|uniref:Subunit 2 of splicing factor 3A n=1 Tax=Hamiltosporidium tvaerminnensis TaxID=1176355 RepID=A0A4Q9L9I4_9MICR|nr:subunit 2 of splicing factor 3A [Hamiltosporidium tvaerminnensis]
MVFNNRINTNNNTNISTKNEELLQKRKRIKKIIEETSSIIKDKYHRINSIGKYECLLCYTLHNTEINYISHCQGTKHQNLLKKQIDTEKIIDLKKNKLSPKYIIRNIIQENKKGHNIQLEYTQSTEKPVFKFINSLEQKVEKYNKENIYLVILCEPYINVGFKIENKKVDECSIISYFNEFEKHFTIQFLYSE